MPRICHHLLADDVGEYRLGIERELRVGHGPVGYPQQRDDLHQRHGRVEVHSAGDCTINALAVVTSPGIGDLRCSAELIPNSKSI